MLLNSFYALVATFGFAVMFNIKGKNLVFASLGGGLSWLIYLLAFDHLGFSNVGSFFIASAIASTYSEIAARLLKTPVTTFIICAIIPLVPGGGMYNTMFQSIQGNITESLGLGIQTLSIAGTVAVASFFVSSIAKAIVLFRRRLKLNFYKNNKIR
ncbi:threonine/serine exporter family protein [Clostridium sp. DJ247]|uniref:threonine/serine exporter family protein n=1 Tax=Clostridium sp. DJ247 TaxID=2726188 RepID=UPI0016296E28|nr:threonine/serine exporter family protein [Clostridium sp. DJ247]MBC2580364.1 threonine/serine exporter [Clostridium sp. DJ247]